MFVPQDTCFPFRPYLYLSWPSAWNLHCFDWWFSLSSIALHINTWNLHRLHIFPLGIPHFDMWYVFSSVQFSMLTCTLAVMKGYGQQRSGRNRWKPPIAHFGAVSINAQMCTSCVKSLPTTAWVLWFISVQLKIIPFHFRSLRNTGSTVYQWRRLQTPVASPLLEPLPFLSTTNFVNFI